MAPDFTEVLARSALVSLTATAIASLIGITLGTALALTRVGGRRILIAAVNTGMAIPTVVAGLAIALLLWRTGPLGGLGLIYTVRGMIIAQTVIATPLIAAITMAAIRMLPPELPEQLRLLGANRVQLVLRLWLEARMSLLAAAMAGFGTAVSEVGAATIVGGNIHGHTQLMTTAIVESVGRGEFGVAIGYGAILLALAFAINGLLVSVQRTGAAWERN
ncbi:tungstate transport system permease protein [Murinocardiopsis flavida]|uniref:Tungstate transport system permease protein n=1 Tax=Murinocardiopsis flavida TaxID=645275 RepID=A0A2P8DKK5_9ACTN|nr:ABC transporter permease [Murinocardiopsis flavida]PSK97728.1 tungstate transport system permease protein [Murinocardiopsis flavida]